MRKLSEKQIIAKLQVALSFYADSANWDGNKFLLSQDVSINPEQCCGNGRIAREALIHNEAMVVCDKCDGTGEIGGREWESWPCPKCRE